MQGIAASRSDNGSSDRVRLHITPFTSDLLDKIIPPSIRPLAQHISFHTVQTFPERGFGYVELPAMEAQKVKKRLSGSTLRGTKVRIEEAQPERKRKSTEMDNEDEDTQMKKSARKEKKRREDGVLPGHELEEGRRVKRGWTDKNASAKTSRTKEKLSRQSDATDAGLEGRKLRFKTAIPPNAAPIDDNEKERAKKRKSKIGKHSKDRIVVQEFSNSSVPKGAAVVNADITSPPLSYEDGQGWLNERGEIIDAEPSPRSRKSKRSPLEMEHRVSAIESRETEGVPAPLQSSMPEEADVVDNMSVDAVPTDSAVETETTKEIHPLEALFKRPTNKSTVDTGSLKHRPQPIDTSFSFFDGPTAEDAEMGMNMPPQTPHTKRDLEWRSIRSAAPTPDTAAIGRTFSFPFAGGSEDDDAGEEDDVVSGEDDPAQLDADVANDEAAATSSVAPERGEESAFRKWFYENRGDLNRGWKKRRREEKKAERQRENRRLSRKVA